MAGNRDEENRAAAREIAARYGVRTLPLCIDLSEPDAAVKLHAETSARGIEIGVRRESAGAVLVRGPGLAAEHLKPMPLAASIARRPRCSVLASPT